MTLNLVQQHPWMHIAAACVHSLVALSCYFWLKTWRKRLCKHTIRYGYTKPFEPSCRLTKPLAQFALAHCAVRVTHTFSQFYPNLAMSKRPNSLLQALPICTLFAPLSFVAFRWANWQNMRRGFISKLPSTMGKNIIHFVMCNFGHLALIWGLFSEINAGN